MLQAFQFGAKKLTVLVEFLRNSAFPSSVSFAINGFLKRKRNFCLLSLKQKVRHTVAHNRCSLCLANNPLIHSPSRLLILFCALWGVGPVLVCATASEGFLAPVHQSRVAIYDAHH